MHLRLRAIERVCARHTAAYQTYILLVYALTLSHAHTKDHMDIRPKSLWRLAVMRMRVHRFRHRAQEHTHVLAYLCVPSPTHTRTWRCQHTCMARSRWSGRRRVCFAASSQEHSSIGIVRKTELLQGLSRICRPRLAQELHEHAQCMHHMRVHMYSVKSIVNENNSS